jgi:uncharacterized protein DUF1206
VNVEKTLQGLVRLGYLAKALVYILIGALAFRVAAGMRGGRLTDQGGTLYVVLRQPHGRGMLLVVAVGLLTYAAWRIAGGILGWQRHAYAGYIARASTVIRGLVYGAVGMKAMKLSLGLRGGDSGPEPLVRQALKWPFGDWMILIVGIGVAWYGVIQINNAIEGRLEPDLDAATLRRRAGDWALPVARAGIGARAVLMILLAFGLLRAGVAHRASAAGGLDASLLILKALPQGAFLLGAAGAGVLAYGIYQLLHARYAHL